MAFPSFHFAAPTKIPELLKKKKEGMVKTY
jgi:hypothetical protein